MVALVLVRRGVAGAAEIVEEVDHLARHRALTAQAGEQLGLRFLDARIDAGPGGELLGHELPELAELHQAGDGIFGEILLGPHGGEHQPGVVARQKAEVEEGGRSTGILAI